MLEESEKELSELRDRAAGFRARIDEAQADMLSAQSADERAAARAALKEAKDGLRSTLREIRELMQA